jgi:hypothetical protein
MSRFCGSRQGGFPLFFRYSDRMIGAEFLGLSGGPSRVIQEMPDARLLVDHNRGTWLPWGRRLSEPGGWPAGGLVPWTSIYRHSWQQWSPERILIRPSRWQSTDHHWVDLRPGFAILALTLRGAPGTPVYVVVLDGGAPKLMPRVAEWEADQTARRRDLEARQEAADDAEFKRAKAATEIFLMEIEGLVGLYSRDEVKGWDKERAQRWWREEVAVRFPRYTGLFDHFWSMNETRRWIGQHRF